MTPDATKPATLYDGKYLRVVKQGRWEFVKRKKISGIVAVVAVTDDRELVLIEQFRLPVGKRVVELPAGLAGDTAGLEAEELATAARRELLEETGYEAADMTRLAAGASSAGLCDEVITLFRATGLSKTGAGEGDGGEDITTHLVPLAGVGKWLDGKVAEGCLIDLKVYSGLYYATTKRPAHGRGKKKN